jgi:hypothetical protein
MPVYTWTIGRSAPPSRICALGDGRLGGIKRARNAEELYHRPPGFPSFSSDCLFNFSIVLLSRWPPLAMITSGLSSAVMALGNPLMVRLRRPRPTSPRCLELLRTRQRKAAPRYSKSCTIRAVSAPNLSQTWHLVSKVRPSISTIYELTLTMLRL